MNYLRYATLGNGRANARAFGVANVTNPTTAVMCNVTCHSKGQVVLKTGAGWRKCFKQHVTARGVVGSLAACGRKLHDTFVRVTTVNNSCLQQCSLLHQSDWQIADSTGLRGSAPS